MSEYRRDKAIDQALAAACRCGPEYTDRGRHASNCGDEGEEAIRAFLEVLAEDGPVTVLPGGEVRGMEQFGWTNRGPAAGHLDKCDGCMASIHATADPLYRLTDEEGA